MAERKGYRVVAPDRYLRVSDEPGTVTVRHGDALVARSARAVRLVEGERPDVHYLPLEDIGPDASLLPSSREFRCRWKGDATWYHVDLHGRILENAAWRYAQAPEALAALRERVAFDRERFRLEVGDEDEGPAPPP